MDVWLPSGSPWQCSGQDLALTAKVLGSIPGEETKIPQVTWQYPTSHMVQPKKKKEEKEVVGF